MEFYDDDDDEEEFPLVRMVQCGVHSIRTTTTASAAEVSRWIEEQLNRFRPPSRPSRSNSDIIVGMAVQHCLPLSRRAAATLQLCIDRHCLIFQISRADECPENLRRFMVDPNVFFVGVWNQLDREVLYGSRHRLVVSRPMDLRLVAVMETGRGRWMTTVELAGLIVQQRGILDNQLVAAGNWEVVQLGMYQVEYACHRAYLCYFIARILITPILYRTGYVDRLLGRRP